MITRRKAKIVDRAYMATVECPECKEDLMLDLDMDINNDLVEIECGSCGEICTISMFDYFAQSN